MNEEADSCPRCWRSFGRYMSKGYGCLCDGSVPVCYRDPVTHSNPLSEPVRPLYRVSAYGDSFAIFKIDETGRASKVGPLFDHGISPKGLSFPHELTIYNKQFYNEEEASKVLSKLLLYFEDAKNKKITKKKGK
jgi:hypothetical protein